MTVPPWDSSGELVRPWRVSPDPPGQKTQVRGTQASCAEDGGWGDCGSHHRILGCCSTQSSQVIRTHLSCYFRLQFREQGGNLFFLHFSLGIKFAMLPNHLQIYLRLFCRLKRSLLVLSSYLYWQWASDQRT